MMNLIDSIRSVTDLKSFRDHVAKVRSEDSQPLRKGKLEHHVARILGVADWNTALGMVGQHEAPENTCKRCESLLDPSGFCIDETCLYNDWPQYIDASSDVLDSFEKRQRVMATMKTDDGHASVEFDAAPYFQLQMNNWNWESLHADLGVLIKEEGYGCVQSDWVALAFRDHDELKGFRSLPGYKELLEAFGYLDALERTRSNKDALGFEVYIDMDDLGQWVSRFGSEPMKKLFEQ